MIQRDIDFEQPTGYTETEDDILWKWYMKGFNSCPTNINNSEMLDGINQKAYITGWNDYLIGDDVPSADYRSKEDILKQIKDNT